MSDEPQIERWLSQADSQRRLGDYDGAIYCLRNVLTREPEHAGAHAMLAFVLLDTRRLSGAAIEAKLALTYGGGEAYSHLAAGAVARCERKLDEAWDHCQIALETEPEDVDAHVIGAQVRLEQNRHADARTLLQRALELESDSTDALVMLARVELDVGNLGEAARLAGEALTIEPGHLDAHVVAGFCDLKRGELDSAEEHARFALQNDPTDVGAIALWTSLKSRRNWFMGLWWRLNAWVSLRSERSTLALMVGSFVLAQLAIIAAEAADLDVLAAVLDWAWLGFCAYTWSAPVLFRRMLDKELKQVQLRPDF
jgi:tetratricopeptide (TPR) repeat protein